MSIKVVYIYKGSVTLPYCNETIEWIVIDSPQPMNTSQLNEFKKLWSGYTKFADSRKNNRVIYELNGREIHAKGIL